MSGDRDQDEAQEDHPDDEAHVAVGCLRDEAQAPDGGDRDPDEDQERHPDEAQSVPASRGSTTTYKISSVTLLNL